MTENNLPVSVEVKDEVGSVTFASDVIAVIAGIAAMEVPGVAGMSGGIVGGIAEILGRKNLTKGVKVEVGSEQTAVDLTMIFDYGISIPSVCRKVQENVKRAIETMAGLQVVEVNIHVVGVKIEKEAPAPEPAPEPRVK